MDEIISTSDALWSLLIGFLLITMVLAGTWVVRMVLSNAMIYLIVGYALGPAVLSVLSPDPAQHATVLGRVAEVALLISLFTVGLKLGAVPWHDRRWLLPLRLAFIAMIMTVGLIAVIGVYGLGLSVGAAVLLGGILAPTDPVLASGVQSEGGVDPDRLRFSLAGEGALNDGTAFPFVLLGLGLLDRYDLGAGGSHWWLVDVLWGTLGGLAIGTTLGTLVGKFVVFLRTRHRTAVGLDEFLSLGLIGVAYGLAQLTLASGFLAVFATGLALQRVKEQPQSGARFAGSDDSPAERARDPGDASAAMTLAVKGFNEQLEKLAELCIVLLVGAMLPFAVPRIELLWFVPVLFVVVRTVAVLVGTLGDNSGRQRVLISWFGIRGIGSIYYLMLAIRVGISDPLAQELTSLTLITVAASIVIHGLTVGPLMRWYGRRLES